MKIRLAVPEKGRLIVLVNGKKNKKNICKTYTLSPHRRLRKLTTCSRQHRNISGPNVRRRQ